MLGDRGVVSLVGAGGKTSLMFKLAHELSSTGESVLTTTTTKIYEPPPDQSPCVIVSGSVMEFLDEAQSLVGRHRHITMAHHRLPGEGKLAGVAPDAADAIWNHHLFRWIIVEADGAAGRPLKAPADHEPVIPDSTHCVVGVSGLSGVGQPLNDRWVFRPDRFAKLAGMSLNSIVTESAVAAVMAHPKGLFRKAATGAIRIVFLNQADTPENDEAGQRIARLLAEKVNTGLKRIVVGQIQADPPVLATYDLKSESL
jgi:probable selenium-dependent hydroxylase accessory protein YqeC